VLGSFESKILYTLQLLLGVPSKAYGIPVMCPSHFCRVRVEPESQALRVRVI